MDPAVIPRGLISIRNDRHICVSLDSRFSAGQPSFELDAQHSEVSRYSIMPGFMH